MDKHDFVLEAVDSDGAIRETADGVAGDSRAEFFRKAGLAAGGTLLASGVLSARCRAWPPPKCRGATSRSSTTR